MASQSDRHEDPTAMHLSRDADTAPIGNVSRYSAPPREGPGTRIGAYQLDRLIGEGGFGSVFAATQERPVQRKVALKILKPGMDTHQVVARFEQERQALAILDHPSIAKVFDAGSTETGRLYFVMELCSGEPIDRFCDANCLNVEQRLGLFMQVCHAVQHAHTKGIIHRDIKPSNILVSARDGQSSAKVIDFGIAKATAGNLTDSPYLTVENQFIGTPEYMSPEQAEGSLDIDTRTDIYSLGVLLYELLTGTTPFSSKDLRSGTFIDIQRIIREVDPPTPSARLSRSAATLSEIAASRKIEPHRLRAIIRGELDWIVTMAMDKDRHRRYESAGSLANDIQHYLSGEAVMAAPPSRAYRLRKLIVRNRGAVAAGAAVVLSLVIGVVAFAWQANVAARERDAARVSEHQQALLREKSEALAASEALLRVQSEASAQHAKEQAERAEQARKRAELVASFMSETLGGAGPSIAKGRNITMLKEMMDRAADRVERGELKEAPVAELQLRSTIGTTYRELGVLDSSQKVLEPAVTLARSIYGSDHEVTAQSLTNLARVLQARGDLAAAEPLFRESLDIFTRRATGSDSQNVATGLNDLAFLLQSRGDLAAAEPLFRRAVEVCKQAHKGDNPNMATSLNDLAALLQARGDLVNAEPLYRESLEMRKRLFPGDHPDVAPTLNNLGRLLQARGDLAGAEPYLRESLEMWKRLFEGDHPSIASGLSNYARLLQARGNLTDAESNFREALSMSERLFPGDHPVVAAILNNLAVLIQIQGDLESAEQYLRRSIEMKRRLYSGDHPSIANGLLNLGTLLVDRRAFQEAESVLREAVSMSESVYGKDNRATIGARVELGRSLTGLGRYSEAESELLAAESAFSIAQNVSTNRRNKCLNALESLYEAWDKVEPNSGYDEKAAAWKQELVTAEPSEP